MMHVGLDLSRKRLDVALVWDDGTVAGTMTASPTADELKLLVKQVSKVHGAGPVCAAIESMTGARFVHDQLELAGWEVKIADAHKVKGIAPLACKTDRIDAMVLATLSRLELVPEIWLPSPEVRAERERARWRLHLVRHRTSLKNRIHQTLFAFGQPCKVSDLFGETGRALLMKMDLPEPWASNVNASLALIDELDEQIDDCEKDLRRLGANHPYIPLLMTVPGIGWILAYTIASEIGDIQRFASPTKLCGYTGLCPIVRQSGTKDYRGPLAKGGPKYLRWALVEAAQVASRNPIYNDKYMQLRKRLGRQRGSKVATVSLARKLTEAIWYMLQRNQPFIPPAGASPSLAA